MRSILRPTEICKLFTTNNPDRSAMAGRSGLFVVNSLQISVGRNMDRIKNAEVLQSFVGLGKTLAKLTAAQYLTEIALMQALSDHPQEELFLVLVEHLDRLQNARNQNVLACLNHGIYHLLAIAGFAPQVHSCCITQSPVIAKRETPKWKAGFSIVGGGVIDLEHDLLNNALDNGLNDGNPHQERGDEQAAISSEAIHNHISNRISHYLNASELLAIQELAQTDLSDRVLESSITDWLAIERLLRAYAQYHFDRPIQSSALIDNCFFNI